jgi:molybdate transport system ATP-binding protein
MSLLVAHLALSREGFSLDMALEAPGGSTVALLGPNGAGKSTALDALAGLQPIAAGRIALGERVWDEPSGGIFVPPQRRSVGVMFQHLALFPSLSVLENVAYGLRSRRRRNPVSAARRALESVGAAHLAGRRPSTLSGGEAQRVALARALASQPDLLLLDEPLSALDARSRPAARSRLREVLAAFAGPRVVVTHDPLEAMTLADRIVVLEGGRVTQEGTADEIRRRPRSPYAAAFVGTNLISGVVAVSGGHHVLDTGKSTWFVVAEGLEAGTSALAAVHPTAIILSIERPSSSARNQIETTVSAVEDLGERVRVLLDGPPHLVAEVTPDAVGELGLAPGVRVWAAIKATRIEVYPDR